MLIALNEQDPRPLYLQIAAEIKRQVSTGELRPGEALPSVRELAESLGVNLHTVHRAYERLRDQGVIHLRLGQRARVAPLRRQPASAEEVEMTLVGRLNELITEAVHLGLSADDFRALVETLLRQRERQS